MKKWRVGLCYSGYAWRVVEAENEDEAYNKVVESAEAVSASDSMAILDWNRWKDADQVEEA
jgi:hypothetical protein